MGDTDFTAKLLETFRVEADEHLKNLTKGLIELEKKLPQDKQKEWVENTFREVHSLKGAARAVGLDLIQSICQSMENVMAFWKQGSLHVSQEVFDALYSAIDFINTLISGSPEKAASERLALPLLMQKLEQLLAEHVTDDQKPYEAAAPIESEPPKQPTEPVAQQMTNHKTIRVSLGKLDKLLQQVEEMLILKLASRRQVDDLIEMQEHLNEWDKKWSNLQPDVHTSRQEIAGVVTPEIVSQQAREQILEFLDWQQEFFRSFKDRLGKLLRMTSQDYRLAGSIVDALLDDTKKVLMQPVATLADAFPRMVRDLSHELGKKVELDLQGVDLEVDRRVLEEMKDPLIHLIRNCIDHGIEKPEDRQKRGKPEFGKVTISASQVSGNSMEITITDDGKGIDVSAVKASAIKQGIMSARDVEVLNDKEALNLIFHSGVSTSPIITELSGRGLGLGIVSEKVDKLGGQIAIESTPDRGTIFKITLPLTLATFRGIHVKVGGRDFIMPTHNVKRVMRVKKEEIKTVEDLDTISVDDHTLPLVSLAALLEIGQKGSPKEHDLVHAVIVKAAKTTIAFRVDQVLNEHEILVKSLGKQLSRVRNILAATVTEWGQVIPILNPQDLIKSAIKGKIPKMALQIHEEAESKQAVILIAEDSITSRMLLKNILEVAGYVVKAAVDGAEAFSIFKTDPIDLLISDVEMPRMDGFTLTEKVRATPKGKDLPIILCTARESQEDREHGIEIGANAYLDKSSFTQTNLLNVIQKLLP